VLFARNFHLCGVYPGGDCGMYAADVDVKEIIMTAYETCSNQGGTLQPAELIFCVTFEGVDGHIYFTPAAKTDPAEVMVGVTTLTSASAGRSPLLLNWAYRNGAITAVMGTLPTNAESELMSQEAKHYGSFFHGLIPTFVQNSYTYDPFHLPEEIQSYWQSHQVQYNPQVWEYKAKRHLAAFCQWCADLRVGFLAVELPVLLREWQGTTFRIGSRMDLVLTSPKLDGDVIIVDMKTGEKSYCDVPEYEYQLSFYRRMLVTAFPQYRTATIKHYNWSPKAWNVRSKTLYTFEERPNTPDAVLAALSTKFWYEHADFLKGNELSFSEKPFQPGQQNYTYRTYYEVIQQFLTEEGY
jgi:hypothetical protein